MFFVKQNNDTFISSEEMCFLFVCNWFIVMIYFFDDGNSMNDKYIL